MIEAHSLTPKELQAGKEIRSSIEGMGVSSLLYSIGAALDQYRCDYTLDPHSRVNVDEVIPYLMYVAQKQVSPDKVVTNIPASILSDIEVIDAALDTMGDDNDGNLTVDAQKAVDALHDARSGLMYWAEKYNTLLARIAEEEQSAE